MTSLHEQFARREALNHIPFAEMAKALGASDTKSTRVASGWRWDEHLNGYVSNGNARFACTGCGHDVETPSFVHCACGKIWNSYPIASASKEAGATRYIAREIPRREGVVLAGRERRTASSKRRTAYSDDEESSRVRIVEDSPSPGHQRTLLAVDGGQILGKLFWWEPSGIVTVFDAHSEGISHKLREAADELRPGLKYEDEGRWDVPADEMRSAARTFVSAEGAWFHADPSHHNFVSHDEPLAIRHDEPRNIPGITFHAANQYYNGYPYLDSDVDSDGYSQHDTHFPNDDDEYRQSVNHLVARHPDGRDIGHLTWNGDGSSATIGVASVHPDFQRQGVANAMLDAARNRYVPRLKHSSELSYQGRQFALADKANPDRRAAETARPFNQGDGERAWDPGYRYAPEGVGQNDHYKEVAPNNDNAASAASDYDAEHGLDSKYDKDGFDSAGFNADGYDAQGYDDEGWDIYGFNRDHMDDDGYDRWDYVHQPPPEGHASLSDIAAQHGDGNYPELVRDDWGGRRMYDDARDGSMVDGFAVIPRGRRTNENGGDNDPRIGAGDMIYPSFDAALASAHHPTNPDQDQDVVMTSLDPDHLYGHPENGHVFTYHPPEGYAPSTDAFNVSSQSNESNSRILQTLGNGWTHGDIDADQPWRGTHFKYEGPEGTISLQRQSDGGWHAGGVATGTNRTNSFTGNTPSDVGADALLSMKTQFGNLQQMPNMSKALSASRRDPTRAASWLNKQAHKNAPGISAMSSKGGPRMAARFRRTGQLVPGHELTAGDIVEQNGHALQVIETKSHLDKEGNPLVTVTMQGQGGTTFTSEYPVAGDPPQFNLMQSSDGGNGEGAEADPAGGPAADPAAQGSAYDQFPTDDATGDPAAQGDPAMGGAPAPEMGGGEMAPPAIGGELPPPSAPGLGVPSEEPMSYDEFPTDDDPDGPLGGMPQPEYDEIPLDPMRMQSRESSRRRVAGVLDDYEYWTRQNDLDPATSLKEYDQTHQITQEEYDLIEQEVMQDAGIHVEGGTGMDSGTQDVGPAFPDMNQSINDAPEIQSFA